MRAPLGCVVLTLGLVACGDDELETEVGTTGSGGAPLACGATEVLVDGACVTSGVPPENCGEGFEADGRGGCSALLPAEACAPGEIAIPGDTACRPLMTCSGARWGRAPLDTNTEFVDASFTGTSNGSESAPWRTIGEAMLAAVPGALVAIAAGTYEEAIWLTIPLRLWGSCTTEVTIVSPASDAGVLTLADGVEVRDLSVTGAGDGIVASALESTIENVWVRDTNNLVGVAVIDANGPASLHMRNSLVEGARAVGFYAAGSEGTLERSVVRASRPNALGLAGVGVGAIVSPASALGSHLMIDRSVVENVRGSGITIDGSRATVDQSLVRDVLPQEADGSDGEGIIAVRHAPSSQASELTLTRSTVERAHEAGVIAVGSIATLQDVTIRDIAVQQTAPANGIGVVAQEDPTARATLTLERALVEQSYTANVMVLGSDGSIQHTILRAADESDGLVVFAIAQPAHASVARSRIEQNPRAGASAFAGSLSFEATLFECNLFHLAIEPWNGVAAQAQDLGQNQCGCGGAEVECKALHQDLTPPEVGF